jgi:hypothetical protein
MDRTILRPDTIYTCITTAMPNGRTPKYIFIFQNVNKMYWGEIMTL